MDHLRIPFNITNQIEHPDRPNYLVFHFREEIKAEQFEAALKEKNLFYERGQQEENDGSIRYLFGVRKSDTDAVERINYIIIGKHREHFIKDKSARWFIVGFGILLGVLALLGALLSK
jgi:hypothetical protein